ncbi:MAG: TerC family protein [Sphingobacteriia bacterium]|nr:TerC family protein [Sphingobacteriia bacterium]
MEFLQDPAFWASLFTLTAMEVVLGIDNIIFVSIIAGRLPADQQKRARFIGLSLALIIRILLLCMISWLAGLTQALFVLADHPISIRDMIMMAGGLFLLGKSTLEIHYKLEGEDPDSNKKIKSPGFTQIIIQILLLDLVFSIDSIITAIGLVQEVGIMITAVIISMMIMMIFASKISNFIEKHPTLKMLALSFLLMVGLLLIAEGLGMHVPKGYVYFAMAFSFGVEMLNLRLRKKTHPVKLHSDFPDKP